MIYLASPYSDARPEVRRGRFLAARRLTRRLIRDGVNVFSPIVYSEPLCLAGDWASWRELDLEFLAFCEQLWVLCLPGWENSTGVQAEIAWAKNKGLPIVYIQDDQARPDADFLNQKKESE